MSTYSRSTDLGRSALLVTCEMPFSLNSGVFFI